MYLSHIKPNFIYMRKITKILFLSGAILLSALSGVKAQEIAVSARMRPPTESLRPRPARPSPRHVWIAEEWAPRGTSYTWKGSYWALPPYMGAKWVPGHWHHVRRGYAWAPGHWR